MTAVAVKRIDDKHYAVNIECVRPGCTNKFLRTTPDQIYCDGCAESAEVLQFKARKKEEPEREGRGWKLTCQDCDKSFTGYAPHAKWCNKCRSKHRNVAPKRMYRKTCEVCGHKFETRYSRGKICSQECRHERQRQTDRNRKRKKVSK